jgi:hypothetical protein
MLLAQLGSESLSLLKKRMSFSHILSVHSELAFSDMEVLHAF